MMEPSTHVLLSRSQDAGGEGRMYTISLVAHAALLSLLVLLPGALGHLPQDSSNRLVMEISIGGPVGPRTGGMNPIGGRPVQQVVTEAPKGPQPVRPPAARTPEMTAPAAKPAPKPRPERPTVTDAPPDARGRTPVTGAEKQAGSAIAETGARGTGFGLTSGGGGTGGYLDVGNFCCPEYLTTMMELIRRNWNSRQDVNGDTMIKFTIQRDGRIVNVELERSSGYAALDLGAQRALLLTRQLPPLPAGFTEPSLTVHLNFQYQR
jgi:protein TonB